MKILKSEIDKELNKDIINGSFKPFYLLFGEEDFLLNYYKNEFKKAFDDDSGLNNTLYNKDNYVEKDFLEFAEKMPFFADKKLIIVDNVQISNEKVFDFINQDSFKEINVFLFILGNDNVDKRTKFYKFFETNGYISELNYQNENILSKLIVSKVEEMQKIISTGNSVYLARKVGNKLSNISNEIDKIIAYIGNRDEIEKEDIDKVVHVNIENNVFEILKCINSGNISEAYNIYANITLMDTSNDKSSKEDIMRILLYNYNQILSVKSLRREGKSDVDICKELKIQKFQLEDVKAMENSHNEEYYIKKIHKICEYNRNLRKDIIDKNAVVEILFS